MGIKLLYKILICFFVFSKIASAEKNTISSNTSQSGIIFHPPVTVSPHRAEYDIKLIDPLKSSVQSAQGKLVIEISDRGDGWTFEQHCFMKVASDTGLIDEFRTTVASWESKDGKHYTFTVTSTCNGQIVECIHGHANADPSNTGAAIYQQPDTQLVRLPPGTLFPLQYMNKVLNTLASGKPTLSDQKFFDGISDYKEAVDINLTVTPIKPSLKVNNKGLIDTDKAWQLQMGVYLAENEDTEPDCEINQVILNSGIILSMVMSMVYGEETFKTKATLTEVKVYS